MTSNKTFFEIKQQIAESFSSMKTVCGEYFKSISIDMYQKEQNRQKSIKCKKINPIPDKHKKEIPYYLKSLISKKD